jgi:hypothetical protein
VQKAHGQPPHIFAVSNRQAAASTAINVKIFSGIPASVYTPLLEKRLFSTRKVPHFYQKSASFLPEKRLFSF